MPKMRKTAGTFPLAHTEVEDGIFGQEGMRQLFAIN